jgi:WD40 repeat protein/tetratricopeptide (TPR) repeat protein
MAVRETRARQLAQLERLNAERNLLEAQQQRQLALDAKLEAERQRDRAEAATKAEIEQRAVADEARAAAESARQAEAQQRADAERERDQVASLNASLEEKQQQQRRMVYAAHMNLIQKAWDVGNTDSIRNLLNATRPEPGEQDLRGFEWNYWHRKVHTEDGALRLPLDEPITASRLSHDASRFAAITMGENRSYRIRVWDTATGETVLEKEIARTDPDGAESDVRFGNTGSRSGPPLRLNAVSPRVCFVDARILAVLTAPATAQSLAANSPTNSTFKLTIWRLDTGEESMVKEITMAHGLFLESLVFSRDGSRFAMPLETSFVQVWDTHTGEEIARSPIPEIGGAARLSEFIALSHDGRRLAIKPTVWLSGTTEPQGITIVELETDQRVVTSGVAVQTLEFSPDGRYLAGLDRGQLRRSPSMAMFDVSTGETLYRRVAGTIAREPGELLDTFRFSANSEWIAFSNGVSADRKSLLIWRAATGEPVTEFKGFGRPPMAVAFRADSSQLTSVHQGGAVLLWDLPAPSVDLRFESPRTLLYNTDQITSPDGRWTVSWQPVPIEAFFAAPKSDDEESQPLPEQLILRDTKGEYPERSLTISGRLIAESLPGQLVAESLPVRFSPDSRLFLTRSVDSNLEIVEAGRIQVWEVASGNAIVTIPLPATRTTSNVFPVASTDERPTTRTIYRCQVADSEITFRHDGRRLAVAIPRGPQVLVPTPWSSQIIAGNREVQVWDLDEGRELFPAEQRPKLEGSSGGLTFTTDGQLLVSFPLPRQRDGATSSGRGGPSFFSSTPTRPPGITVWDAESGQMLWADASVRTCVFTATPSLIAGTRLLDGNAGSGMQQFVIWDARTGKEECQLTIPADRNIKTFAVNADLTRAALASGGDVFVYDTTRKVEQHVLRGHSGSIETVCFSADDTRIAAMSIDPNSIAESSDVEKVRSNTGAHEAEAKVWDVVTGQELLSLAGTWNPASFTSLIAPHSPTITDATLQLAAGAQWEAEPLSVATAADELVRWITETKDDGRMATRSELLNRLRLDSSENEEVRAAAEQLVRDGMRELDALVAASLELSLPPEQSAEAYQRALELADESCEVEPRSTGAWFTRGTANYRLGRFQDALADLKRIEELQHELGRSAWPQHLILLAMTHHQMGNADLAQQYLREFDQHFNTQIGTSTFIPQMSRYSKTLRDEATDRLGFAAAPEPPLRTGFSSDASSGTSRLAGISPFRDPAVLKELAISDAQRLQLDELFASYMQQMREYFASRRQLEPSDPSADGSELVEPLTSPRDVIEKLAAELSSVLTPEQTHRLQQLRWQSAGDRAILDATLREQLELTDDQRTKIDAVDGAAAEKRKALPASPNGLTFEDRRKALDEMRNLNTESAKQILEVLTDEQKQQLKSLLGEPFDLLQLRGSPAERFQGVPNR